MRWIDKPAQPPAALCEYVTAQTPVGHGLDYKTFADTGAPCGGSRGKQLLDELTAEQCGLCAYTGAGIDSRLGTPSDPITKLKFSAHNEHLKPQSVCRKELEAAGRLYGTDPGEDMDHRNIVAALLVSGDGEKGKVARRDLFGASHRGNVPVPVVPTDCSCENRFTFDLDGGINPTNPCDQDAKDTIDVLNLGHETLAGWRAQAIVVFLEGVQNRTDAAQIVTATTTPQKGWLPEYSFAIRQVVQRLLNETP